VKLTTLKGRAMDIQKIINAMGEQSKQERSKYHMTLGELKNALWGGSNKDFPVLLSHNERLSVENPHSYRGYYSDLSIEPSAEMMTVGKLLEELSAIQGTKLTGYKGGEYLMDAAVPVWISHEGSCSGYAVMDVMHNDTNVTLVTKYID
jgi:hypothetical protein